MYKNFSKLSIFHLTSMNRHFKEHHLLQTINFLTHFGFKKKIIKNEDVPIKTAIKMLDSYTKSWWSAKCNTKRWMNGPRFFLPSSISTPTPHERLVAAANWLSVERKSVVVAYRKSICFIKGSRRGVVVDDVVECWLFFSFSFCVCTSSGLSIISALKAH